MPCFEVVGAVEKSLGFFERTISVIGQPLPDV